MAWLQDYLGLGKAGDVNPDYSATIQRIESTLSHLPEENARFLACVALLAARVANADQEVSAGEEARIRAALRSQLGLNENEAYAVAKIALESELSLEVENHLVTRKLNELASRERKFEVLRTLFHIATEDDISEAESDLIGHIASALLLSRQDFLAVRSEFNEHRAILKSIPRR